MWREEQDRQRHEEGEERHVEHELLSLESRMKREQLVLRRIGEAVDEEAL